MQWLSSLQVDGLQQQVKLVINGKICKVDGFDPKTNTVYEFYGDFWHGNPDIYEAGDLNRANKQTYGELYNDAVKREKVLRKHGYKVVSMWENDWKKLKKDKGQ